jgi:hypothetical protein
MVTVYNIYYMNNIFNKRLRRTLSNTQQQKDTITQQIIDRAHSSRLPHRSTLILFQLLSNSLARLSTFMLDTQQI